MSNEMLIEKADLKVGDTYWFSGYWCTVTRIETCRIEGECPVVGKIFGRFPYTPEGKDTLLGHIYEAGSKVTVRRDDAHPGCSHCGIAVDAIDGTFPAICEGCARCDDGTCGHEGCESGIF